MSSINPFEIWLSPLSNPQSRHTLSHRLPLIGGGQ